jgi:hypothetical protein
MPSPTPLVFAVLFALAPAADAAVAKPPRRPPPRYFGLAGVDLDAWTDGFWRRRAGPIPKPGAIASLIKASAARGDSADGLYAALLAAGANRPLPASEDYRRLAADLLEARDRLRPAQARDGAVAAPSEDARRKLLLLAVLAEETLYAGTLAHPAEAGRRVERAYAGISPEDCSLDGRAPKIARFRGMTLCQGDVIVSKEDSLFSSFAARMVTAPQLFTHSTLAFVDSSSPTKELLLLEANGQDGGVKLRRAEATYKDAVRVFVYRLRHPDAARRRELLRAAILGAERYHARMRELTDGDPVGKAAFPFDFFYQPDDPSRQYCSEVAYDAYARGGLDGGWNPYPRALWNTFASPGGPDFWKKALGLPDPVFHDASDVELNPNYELVGWSIDPSRLPRERIDTAVADTAYELLREDYSGVRRRYLEAASRLGDGPVTAQDIAAFEGLGYFDAPVIAYVKHKLAPGPNLKMVAFFIVTNGYLGGAHQGSFRSRLAAIEAADIARRGRGRGLLALRSFVRARMEGELRAQLRAWDERLGL